MSKKQWNQRLLFLSLFASFSISSLSSASDLNTCSSTFFGASRPSKEILELDFIQEPEKIGDSVEPRYTPTGRTVELKEIPTTNQCRTSECYLFSFVNFLNVQNSNQDASIRISHPLLVANKFLMHIREGVWYGTDSDRLTHDLKGGWSFEALNLSRQVGLAPDESWKPKVPFEQWDTQRIYSTLETKVPEWHRYIQSLANQYGNWDNPKVRQAEKDAYAQLRSVIEDYSGQLPKNFDFRGKSMTPSDFEKLYGAPRTLTLFIDNKENYGLSDHNRQVLNEASPGGWRQNQSDVNQMLQMAVNWVKAGQPVIIDFKWKEGGHSMLVVGYEVGGNGKVVRFKIMNSWGPHFGNDGYTWYTYEDIYTNIKTTMKFGNPGR